MKVKIGTRIILSLSTSETEWLTQTLTRFQLEQDPDKESHVITDLHTCVSENLYTSSGSSRLVLSPSIARCLCATMQNPLSGCDPVDEAPADKQYRTEFYTSLITVLKHLRD